MEPVIILTRIKVFECKNCSKVFPSSERLENHSRTHKHGGAFFKCKDCNSWFQTNRECTHHEMSHIPRKSNSYYNNIVGVKHNLKEEVLEESPMPQKNESGSFTCSKCDKEFKTLLNYKGHYNLKHCRKYLCEFCGRGFGTEGLLIAHLKTHLDKIERPYKCDVCGKGYTQKGTVIHHKKRMHDRIFDQKCTYCEKVFADAGSLNLHLRTHTGYKPYECSYCTKTFSDPSAIKRHIRTHTGEMRYACEECPMKFSDASGFIAHKKRHVGIKKFKCTFCKKKFIDAFTLKNHVESQHERLKIYECDHCGKRYTTRILLSKHIRTIHDKNSAKYKCNFCSKRLTTKRFYERHLLNIHNVDFNLEDKPKSDGFKETKLILGSKKDRGNTPGEENSLRHEETGTKLILGSKKDNTHKEENSFNSIKHEEVSNNKTEASHKLETNSPCKCQYCEEEFNDKTSSKVQMCRFHGKENNKKVTEKKVLHWLESNKKLNSETSLSRDVEIEMIHENAWYCNICEAEFFTVEDLERHTTKCFKNNGQKI